MKIKISTPKNHRFVAAGFSRNPGDDSFVRVLERQKLLDLYALGTRRGTNSVPPERTRLQPIFGLLNYLAVKTLPTFTAESLRFRTFGLFDRWVQNLLTPGQHLFVGTAFAPNAMRWVQKNGGMTFLQSWTSHPQQFWDLLSEEQRLWGSHYLPSSRYYQERAVKSAEAADYICVASDFVRNSFLKRGYSPERLLFCPYPVDLKVFADSKEPRPLDRPFTIVHTGGLSLRKGAPYLLEAFRIIRKEVPDAVLRIKRHLRDDVKDIVKRNSDLPIEWSENLDLAGHVRRYQTSDLLLFPSIEDGYAFVVAEALACGLPVITTPNTGASDLVKSGVNGEVVPIRNAPALAEAALKWWERLRKGERIGGREELVKLLGFPQFEENFIANLTRIGIKSQCS